MLSPKHQKLIESFIAESMHILKKGGDSLGALALICIDNPMLPGTGHRICNDCMKGCVFQKQEPVNIPQIETGVLTDVLQMPWGVEIYGLLTRWNPLNVRRPYALPHNGKNVLVVGLGPAGYTLAHFLVNEGFGVVGIDGLKIEPLPEAMVGTDRTPPRPIRDWDEIYSPLDERVLEGFGGVSEYGITVRWDKNFLTLLHLTLDTSPTAAADVDDRLTVVLAKTRDTHPKQNTDKKYLKDVAFGKRFNHARGNNVREKINPV